MTEKFFEERKEQSEAKARIVTKYFFAWARVIMPTAEKYGGKIAYIDLYAGPGRYKDGAASTPLLIIEKAIEHPKNLSDAGFVLQRCEGYQHRNTQRRNKQSSEN